MAKQVLKITNWVGGLNCATDPRDIEANQFAQNWNITDDVGGILRKVGGAEDSIVNLDHDNTNQQTGYGLFTAAVDNSFSPFDGTLSDGYETGTTVRYNDLHANAILDNTGDFSSNWTRTGDFAIDLTDATYTHSTGAGTLYQTAAQFANAAANDTMYKLTFTISSVDVNYAITSITLKGGTGYIAAEDISLFPDSNPYNNTYTRYFLSAANVSGDKFQLDVASSGGSFNLDDVSLVKTSAIQLASTPSYIDSSLYDNQDHFQNMTILIYEGTGLGQSRTILGYNGTQKVAGLDADFGTAADATSKYKIYRWLSNSFGDSNDNNWITNNDGDNLWPDTDGNYKEDAINYHLITKKTSITNNESSDMGYIELIGSGEITGNDAADPQVTSLTIKPGIEYYLSFYARVYQKYFNYVSDATDSDRVPFVTLHSTTTTDGTDTGMHLFADNTWISDVTSISSTITITDVTEINNGDKVNLIATDGTSHDFTAGDVAGGGTWIAETDNNTTATNLATQINANTKFSASADSAVVKVTQAVSGDAGITTVTLTDSGTAGMSKTNFTGNIQTNYVDNGDFEDGSIGSDNPPSPWTRVGTAVVCSFETSNQYGGEGNSLLLAPSGSFAMQNVEIITNDKNQIFDEASDWVEYSPDGTAPTFGDDASPQYLEITRTVDTEDQGAELPTGNMTTLIVGRTYRVKVKIWAGSTLTGYRIGLGAGLSAAFSIGTDTTHIIKDIVVSNASGNLLIYSENTGTDQWFIDDVSVTALEPSSFIYQDIECEENQLHHLNFVHSSAAGPVQYAIMDREDTTGSLGGSYGYITPWTSVNPSGAITTYKFLNQIGDSLGLGGQLETSYARFKVPSHSGDRTIRIMMSCSQASSNCAIDGVTLFKGWNDLVTMSKNAYGANPFGGAVAGWNKYTTTFKLPNTFSETSDWVLRIYGGKTGYQSGATYDQSTADTQKVEFQDIRLESKQADNLTFLSDNLSDTSKIKIHTSNGGYWDSNLITWIEGVKSQPTYTNVYGATKIVDGNFNNGNNNLLFFFNNRTIMNKYHIYGYELVQDALCTNPSLKITTTNDSQLLTTVFDGIGYINTRYADLDWEYSSPDTNWKAENIDSDQGILMRYYAGTSDYGWNIYDPDDVTAPYTQSTARGMITTNHVDDIDSGRHHVYLWLQGNDGTGDDMGSVLTAGGDIAKLEYEFDYETLTDRRWKSPNGAMTSYAGPIIKVECGKVNETILPGGTTEAILQPVVNGFYAAANSFERIGPAQYFGDQDGASGITIQDSFNGVTVGTSEDRWTTLEASIGQNADFNRLGKTVSGVFNFEIGQIAKTNDIMFKITIEYPIISGNNDWRQFFNFYSPTNSKYERIYMRNLNVHAYDSSYTLAGDSVVFSDGNDLQVNFKFGTPTNSSGSDWEGRKFTVGVTSVNIFGEENYISEGDKILGEDSAGASNITAGQAPVVNVDIGNNILKDSFKKETKIYLKDNESDIWHFLFHINHDTGKIHSSVSGKESIGISNGTNNYTSWQINREDMLSPNQIDTYESETFLTKVYTQVDKGNMTCRYKAAVIANDKLYVGNIYQNGKVYSDRMIISPKGKYNILPSTNFIDVAINDGDEITALAFYKDKLLQFKKKKVFIINTSGDYEFLEDTLQDIGVNQQCQITTTPFGIVWVNGQGCFVYNGEKLSNLIDGKIAPTSDTTFVANNYWRIQDGFTPLIGYLRDKKSLLILNDSSNWAVGTGPEGFQYSFITQSWTFLHWRTPDSGNISYNGNKSNMTIDKDGNLIWHTSALNHIIKWNDAARNYNDTVASDGSVVTFITKDFDFGEPSVRKKIYKIYVTYKSVDPASSAADSKVKVQYATNGGTSYTDFPAGDNYNATNGLEGATSWTTAILKPTSSINNIYSFQLRFVGASVVPSGFQINDFSIVYRIKRIK